MRRVGITVIKARNAVAVRKYNKHHMPAGTPAGGQFGPQGNAPSGESSPRNSPASSPKGPKTKALFRGINLKISPEDMSRIDKLFESPMKVEDIDQHLEVGPIILDLLNQHKNGVGRHWTSNPKFADKAAWQGGQGGVPIRVTARGLKRDVSTGQDVPTGARGAFSGEQETTFNANAEFEIIDIEIVRGQSYRSVWKQEEVKKYNKHHMPAGTPVGGQFGPQGGRGGSSNGAKPPKKRVPAKKATPARTKPATGGAEAEEGPLDDLPRLKEDGSTYYAVEGYKYNPDGVHRVKDVKEALRLIGEGKDVELDSTIKIHTLLKELNTMVQEAKAAGEDAKNYDLCGVTVKGTSLFCEDSKGILRKDMPQIGGTTRPGSRADKLPKNKDGQIDATDEFISHLRSTGVAVVNKTVSANSLKATQNELIGPKVAGMTNNMDFDPGGRAIFTTSDGYIIDGHHRWASAIGRDSSDGSLGDFKMKVIEVDMPITAALRTANAWADDFGIQQKSASVKKIIQKARQFLYG